MGKGGEDPKVVIALKYFGHLLGIIAAITALPTQLFFLFVVKVFGHADLWKNRAIYICLFLFRWLFSSLAIPFWAAQPAVMGYYLFVYTDSVGPAAGAAVGLAVSSILGLIYIEWNIGGENIHIKFRKKTDSEDEDDGFFMIFGQGWLDMFAFLSFLLCIGTVIRIPCLIIVALSKPDDWRYKLAGNGLLCFLDIILLPLYILQIIFFWRIPYSVDYWREKAGSNQASDPSFLRINWAEWVMSPHVRAYTIVAVLQGLVDFLIFSITLPAYLLAPWRIYVLLVDEILPSWNEVPNAEKWSDARVRVETLKHGWYAVLDFLSILLGIVVCCTWRGPFLIYMMTKVRETAVARRSLVLICFGLFFIDILSIIASILVLVTGYRIPKLWELYKQIAQDWNKLTHYERIPQCPDVQYRMIALGLKVIRDLPFLLMALLFIVFFWRIPFLIPDLKAVTGGMLKKGAVIAYHFGYVFIDILDFPFVVWCGVILITGWRAPALIKEVKQTIPEGRNSLRLTVLLQIGLWFLDILTVIPFFILMITIYRAKDTIDQLRELYHQYFKQEKEEPEVPKAPDITTPLTQTDITPTVLESTEEENENPTPQTSRSSMFYSWHAIVWKQFGLFLLDAPIFLSAILTLWRLPWLIIGLKENCETAVERRVMVLTTLLKTVKDIAVFIIVVILCLSWRIVSLINMIRDYKQGDDEHVMVWRIFVLYLQDFPFFLCYVLNLPFLWRSIPVTLYIIFLPDVKEEDYVSTRRTACAATLVVSLLDCIFAALTLVVICCFWRIPSLYELFTKDPLKCKEMKNPYASTFAFYAAVLCCIASILLDFLQFIQIIFIFCGILHIPSFIERSFNVLYHWNEVLTDKISEDIREDVTDSIEYSKNELLIFRSMSSLRIVIHLEFLASLRDIPHLVYLPLKAIGFILLPLYFFVNWQIESEGTLTKTVLSAPLYWINSCSKNRLNFWGIHGFAIMNIVSIFFIIPVYIALIPMCINSLILFICTFGDPLWAGLREHFGYIGLGVAEGCCAVFDNVILVNNLIWIPIFLFVQWILFFLPLLLFVLWPLPLFSFSDYMNVFFYEPEIFWTGVGQIPQWGWLVFAFWILIMITSESLTYHHAVKNYQLCNPITAILWLIRRLTSGKAWAFYRALLAIPAQWAFQHRNTCGCLGEFLVAPIVLIWTLWPISIPFITNYYLGPNGWYFWFLSAVLVGFLSWKGIFMASSVMKLSWREIPKIEISPYPRANLSNIRVVFPPTGGLNITFTCVQPPNLQVEQALLFLEGVRPAESVDPFWKSLGKIFGSNVISMGKMSLYPVKLLPTYLQWTYSTSGQTQFSLVLPPTMRLLGKEVKIEKSTLQENFTKIISEGDPEVEWTIEFTSRPLVEGPYKKHGYITKFRTRFSSLLKSDQNYTSLECNIMDSTGIWVEPEIQVFDHPLPSIPVIEEKIDDEKKINLGDYLDDSQISLLYGGELSDIKRDEEDVGYVVLEDHPEEYIPPEIIEQIKENDT